MRRPEEQECPVVPVEGWKQVEELSRSLQPELLLHTPSQARRMAGLSHLPVESRELPAPLMRRLSTVESSQGVVAFFPKPVWSWHDITPWVLYLDRLRDPGNLGSLIRTAHATGRFSVVTSAESVSLFNGKVIRASAGALFVVPFLEGEEPSTLKARGYTLWASTVDNGQTRFRARPPLALVIGNEASGLTPELRAMADLLVTVPMAGGASSLNAAVAGAILMYQIVEQADQDG